MRWEGLASSRLARFVPTAAGQNIFFIFLTSTLPAYRPRIVCSSVNSLHCLHDTDRQASRRAHRLSPGLIARPGVLSLHSYLHQGCPPPLPACSLFCWQVSLASQPELNTGCLHRTENVGTLRPRLLPF